MSNYTEVPLQQQLLNKEPVLPTVPLPAAYPRNFSYNYPTNHYYAYTDKNLAQTAITPLSEFHSLKSSRSYDDDWGSKDPEPQRKLGRRHTSVLLILGGMRFYVRVFTVLVIITSFSLVMTAVISFATAQRDPFHRLENAPQPPVPITDHPCVVFSGVSVMNLVISVSLLIVSCCSRKFRKSSDLINAVFTLTSSVGFATSMGTCFFLNKESVFQNDLWKWSCNNHKNGVTNDVLDFNMICHVVDYGWKFGLVQASLELLTFLIGITTFVLLKFSNFSRFGIF